PAWLVFDAELQLAAAVGVLRRIAKQVHQYLTQSTGVGLQPNRRLRQRHPEPLIALADSPFDAFNRVPRHDAQIDSLALQGKPTAPAAQYFEKIVEESCHLAGLTFDDQPCLSHDGRFALIRSQSAGREADRVKRVSQLVRNH